MTIEDIIIDIHALHEDLEAYERKYGVLSETFYQSYMNGEEPENDSWMLDWQDWAGAYEIWLRRQKQYRHVINQINKPTVRIIDIIARTARHEPIQITA